MALHEKMKLALIAEELFTYFMNKGYKTLDVSMEIGIKETTFTVSVPKNEISLEEELGNDLYCSREKELEEYGWDLNYDSSNSDLLQNLSMLIDYYDITKVEKEYKIVFTRKNH
jgi:hypothetical protein